MPVEITHPPEKIPSIASGWQPQTDRVRLTATNRPHPLASPVIQRQSAYRIRFFQSEALIH
ncbi:hypothetical protein GCWU000342_00099 [Shuttleworthella satelles DSM 14600]|uniref:Uncharacterized protein n=1 Tax=Shuttleworthella satelles DSM 14600 TaxID=626523 RepID=C4G7W2_9FIRM|nr:hypothetical protein GCWU000342_00099 [Shuttleworthia satelles DSM 14600]